jgi:hypothetical protein
MPEIHKAKQENRKPDMRIVPVNFNSEHKAMLGHCKMILEQEPGKIAINPDRFDKLITSLRTAVDNDGTLDKEATSYNEMLCCLITTGVQTMMRAAAGVNNDLTHCYYQCPSKLTIYDHI